MFKRPVTATSPISAVNAAHGIVFDTHSHKLEKKSKLTRLELSEVLTNEYLYAKQTWDLERDSLIRQATKVGEVEPITTFD
jgi:hypothetical protein